MNANTWIEWCGKQLGDFSKRLSIQGYTPGRIEYLIETNPEFGQRFESFNQQIAVLMDEMAENPDGYHHYSTFTEAKSDFLKYTNYNRAKYLDLGLAEIA